MIRPLTPGGHAQLWLMRRIPRLACRVYCRHTATVVWTCDRCC